MQGRGRSGDTPEQQVKRQFARRAYLKKFLPWATAWRSIACSGLTDSNATHNLKSLMDTYRIEYDRIFRSGYTAVMSVMRGQRRRGRPISW